MTETYIALLRGINVSGRNIIKMSDLRDMMNGLEIPESTTYIQSGNIIFNSSESDTEKLRRDIVSGISARFGFKIPVLVLSSEELTASLFQCPFPDDGESKPVGVYITFMSEIPRRNASQEINGSASSSEQWMVKNNFFYLDCPSGYGKTKLTNEYIEKCFGVRSTTRNIRTVRKLSALAKEKENLQPASDR